MANNVKNKLRTCIFYVCNLLLLFHCISCVQGNLQNRVETVLEQAGKNKCELEKVLSHYQREKEKLAAARFLIANMLPHHSFIGKELDSLKRLKKESILKGRISDEVVKQWKSFDYRNLHKIKDVEVIKAEMLIDNIDLAFDVWEKRSWSKYYSFEDFCEYILPYRVGNEPLENWRRVYYERYAPVLDSLYRGNDVVKAAQVLSMYLKKEGFANYTDFNLPHLGALFLLENRVGYCRENCDIVTYVMRALGIPVAMDFYEVSPSYNSRHFWSALLDTTGLAIPFNYTEQVPSRHPEGLRKMGKVYRSCYGIQLEKYVGLYADRQVPHFFRHPLLKDVGNEYFPNNSIKLHLADISGDWAYLCVYTGRELYPIDISKILGDEVVFYNVEPELIYFVAFCRDGNMVPADYPFFFTGEVVNFLIPNEQEREEVVLTRKYPIGKNPLFLSSAVGVKIEGANRPDFKDAELLYMVADTPTVNYNVLYSLRTKKYRYVAYSSPQDKRIQLAEWHMYGLGDYPLMPERIWTNHALSKTHRGILDLMNDGDWSSFYMSAVEGEKLYFDLGKPQVLTKFTLIPRNDDNYIHLGDEYELYYHGGIAGWKSLGRRVAERTELHYDNVPQGALLWLRNHTRGKEERCFYIAAGKQIFQ